jgi:hypothetical protein
LIEPVDGLPSSLFVERCLEHGKCKRARKTIGRSTSGCSIERRQTRKPTGRVKRVNR